MPPVRVHLGQPGKGATPLPPVRNECVEPGAQAGAASAGRREEDTMIGVKPYDITELAFRAKHAYEPSDVRYWSTLHDLALRLAAIEANPDTRSEPTGERAHAYTTTELDLMAANSAHGYVRGFAATLAAIIGQIGLNHSAAITIHNVATVVGPLTNRLEVLEAGAVAHSAEHRELDAALARIHEAVPQSAAPLVEAEGPKCMRCDGPATFTCAGVYLCDQNTQGRSTCLPGPKPPAPQPEPTPDERDRWLPRPQCQACLSVFTVECSRCGDSYCGSHRYTHSQECWMIP